MKIVIRNDEKKDKAVSAIIGTILIVAITVVLAATLYAVLGGFGGLIGKPTPTASMTVSSSGVGGANEIYTLTFTSVSTNVSLSDVILRVTIGSSTYSSTTLASSVSGYTPTMSLSGATPTSTAAIAIAGSGSYLTYDTTITLTITPSSGSVTPALSTIALIYTTSGGNIAGPENV
jgi:flagellin-like protein